MGTVQRLEDLRDHRAMRRAARMVAQGCLRGGCMGADHRHLAERIGLSDWWAALDKAQEALATAGRAGDMLGVAESHRVLGVLWAGKGNWEWSAKYARLSLELGTLHEAEARLLLAISAARGGGGGPVEEHLEATVQICTETGNQRYKRTALLELAVHLLQKGRPRPACTWLATLGQMDLDKPWQARRMGLLYWAGRQMGNAGVMQMVADEIARVALDCADPGIHALVHWVLAEGDWDAGRREEAVYQARIGRRRVAAARLAHRTPEFPEILPDIACTSLLELVDRRLAHLMTRAEIAVAPGQEG